MCLFNIYPDEVNDWIRGERAYLSGRAQAPVFQTLWSDIELRLMVCTGGRPVLKLVGIRPWESSGLPAALFARPTVCRSTAFVRCVWGRAAAIAGASIMALAAAKRALQPDGTAITSRRRSSDIMLFLHHAWTA